MIDCPNCGNSYEKHLSRCTTCQAENPVVANNEDVFRTARSNPPSKTRGIIIGGSISGAVIVAVMLFFGMDFPTIFAPPNQTEERIIPESEKSENSINDDAQEAAGHVEIKGKNLLTTRVFLSPDDSKSFQIAIPDQNVAILEGSIKVSGGQYVSIQFLNSNGGSYCRQVSECSYNVYGETSTHTDRNNEVNIPVKGEDLIRLTVTNTDFTELQVVDVNLYVSYPEGPDRILMVPENEPSEPLIVDVSEEFTELESVEEEPKAIASSVNTEKTSIEDYQQHALQLINEDRKDFGLSPVELSENEAAQLHAEDMLATGWISHWTTDGMKPYMKYTVYGGTGAVGQNAATGGYAKSDIPDCQSGRYFCPDLDIQEQIEELEYSMMYDDASSNWGHRDNILDKHHTHVSIGIAYDEYSFAMIQNFEDNYIEFTKPITTDNKNIQLVGQFEAGIKMYGINIFYDDTPTSKTYHENKYETSYGLEEMVAGVVESGYYYEDIATITANKWYENKQSIDIRFSLGSIDDESGVYTIVTWVTNSDGDQFPATTYSVFVT